MEKQIKLLTIDDDQTILGLISNFFTLIGYTVFKAKDGEEGLEIFNNEKPNIVLVDLKMPKVDGFQVLETIRKESSDTPVLVISGEGEMTDVIRALRLGAWNYQTKPIDNLTFLQHNVEQALEKASLIKENKAYQEGLEKRLGTIIENFNGFIFTCDKDQKITYINPALLKYLGHDATGEVYYEAVLGLESDSPWSVEYEHGLETEIQSRRDGRWYYAIKSPITDRRGDLKECQIILYDITERKKKMLDLQEREEYLRKENMRLRASMSDRYKFGNIIGKSTPMQEVYENIINASASDAGVIIYGESGTGKELIARAIHENSDRKNKRLVYVNCGSIPENLIESEFFGYKKGAFTGATKDKHGFLDIAEGSTLFLDEIGEIPLNMQIKLLRAIEGNGYTPVGSTEVKNPNIRIIAATNRDLKELVRQGLMRQDFFYRIQIIPVHLPPLRERKEDIPLLVDHFIKQYDEEEVPSITPSIARSLQNYDWPGNVRELQNTIHRFVTLKKLDFMGIELKDNANGTPFDDEIEVKDLTLNKAVEVFEKKLLKKYLDEYNWHKSKVAEVLDVNRRTLFNKMKKYDLELK
ncbi:MAG: sigma 54-interacting transcriptional regulator [Desulfobacteraceae bacterium]|jgi:DNA-binding NtrC family response regulator